MVFILFRTNISPSSSNFDSNGSFSCLILTGVSFYASSTRKEILAICVSYTLSNFRGTDLICTVAPSMFSPEYFVSLMLFVDLSCSSESSTGCYITMPKISSGVLI